MTLASQLDEAKTLVRRLENEIAHRNTPIEASTMRDCFDQIETRLVALEVFCIRLNPALATETGVNQPIPF